MNTASLRQAKPGEDNRGDDAGRSFVGTRRVAFVLGDGTYEAVVVDAFESDDDAGVVVLDLAVLTGVHKGEVVTVRASGFERDTLDLLAIPATLTVTDGQPGVQLEG